MKGFRCAAGISFAFSIGHIPAAARSSTLVERSLASTSRSQPEGNAVRSDIASVYGSSPVEHAALQTRTPALALPASASRRQAGKTRSARNSKWRGSRKKWVSFVQIASSIRMRSASSPITQS